MITHNDDDGEDKEHVVFVSRVLFTVRNMDENELTRHAEEICGSVHVSELEHLEDLEDEVTASICSVKSTPDWIQSSKEGIFQALRHRHDLAVSRNLPHMRNDQNEEDNVLPLGIYVHVEKTFYADCEDETHIHNKFVFDCINEDLHRILEESTSCAIRPVWRLSNARPALFPMLSRFSSDSDVVLWLKESFRNAERSCIQASDDQDEGMRIAELVNSEVQMQMRPGGTFWLRRDHEDFVEAGKIADDILDELISEDDLVLT